MDPSPDDVRLNWDVLVRGISYFIFQNIPQISKGIFLKGVCGIPNYLVHIPDSERFVAAWQKTGGLRGARFDVNLFHADVRAAGRFQHLQVVASLRARMMMTPWNPVDLRLPFSIVFFPAFFLIGRLFGNRLLFWNHVTVMHEHLAASWVIAA